MPDTTYVIDRYSRLDRAITASVKNSGVIDLSIIWEAAGSTVDRSPWEWLSADPGRADREDVLVGELGIGAGLRSSCEYARYLGMRFALAFSGRVVDAVEADPVRFLVSQPSAMSAGWARLALSRKGITQDQAGRDLIAGAVALTRGMDEFQRETAVCRVQRAIEASTAVEL